MARHRQAGLAQSRPGDGESVDRVGLADGAGVVSDSGGEAGADPQDHLPGGEERALEAAVDVAAVLQGEAQLALLGELAGPGEQALVAFFGAADRQLAEQLSRRVLTAAAVWVSLWGSE